MLLKDPIICFKAITICSYKILQHSSAGKKIHQNKRKNEFGISVRQVHVPFEMRTVEAQSTADSQSHPYSSISVLFHGAATTHQITSAAKALLQTTKKGIPVLP